MKRTIAIIDGYNVIHRDAGLRGKLDKSLASARDGLIAYCRRWLSTRGDISEFWIVFDGDSSVLPWSGSPSSSGVRVVFTRTKEDADDRILDLLRDRDHDVNYLVISCDNYVSGNAKTHGARQMPIPDFFGMLSAGKRGGRRPVEDTESTGLSPSQEREINESLKKAWGLE